MARTICASTKVTSALCSASLWIMLAASACTAAPEPANVAASTETCVAAREPEPPQVSVEPEPPPELDPTEPEPPPELEPTEPEPSFEPTDAPWRNPKTVVSKGRLGCHVTAVLDPKVLVVYSMIDVYSLIAESLHTRLQPSLPARAKRPPCAGGACQPNAPNAVVIDDAEPHPLDSRALGFVVPIGAGYWVLPLAEVYREYHCMPNVETETVADGHARMTILHQRGEEIDCDEVAPDDACGTACFYSGATQYDLFYDTKSNRALLVTRSYDELDDSDVPKPPIELVREADVVRITGCKAKEQLAWPAPR